MSKRVRTTRRLEVWLKDTSVALFVLNLQRRLVFFNAGCERVTGWSAPDLLGQVCDFVTEADTRQPAALLASLAPPMDVWQGKSLTSQTLLGCRNSDPLQCVVHYFPLTDHDRKIPAVLGIILPMNEPVGLDETSAVQRSHLDLAALRHSVRQRYQEDSLIGRGRAMQRLMNQMKLARRATTPVLFEGETGTGKKYLARLIHQSGESATRAFVPLDCQNLPADHLESTLDRMVRARSNDSIHPGTVFFDQIDSLPRDLQRRVLDLIESHSSPEIRVIAASIRPLDSLVKQDLFLGDLQMALTALVITVPPLRSRPEDLEPLAQYFLEELNRGDARQVNGFHDDVWQQFRRYDWPGNVRELRAVVQAARAESSGPLIEPSHLPFGFRVGVDRQSIGPARRRHPEPLDSLLLKVEREQIELALTEALRNKAKAAELLGITRPRLYRRMEILGIEDHEPADPEVPVE